MLSVPDGVVVLWMGGWDIYLVPTPMHILHEGETEMKTFISGFPCVNEHAHLGSALITESEIAGLISE